jgi:hypothetical protein
MRQWVLLLLLSGRQKWKRLSGIIWGCQKQPNKKRICTKLGGAKVIRFLVLYERTGFKNPQK